MISITLDLNIWCRKPFTLNLIDIAKREFTPAILLFGPRIIHSSLLRDSEPIRLFETPRSLSETKLIITAKSNILETLYWWPLRDADLPLYESSHATASMPLSRRITKFEHFYKPVSICLGFWYHSSRSSTRKRSQLSSKPQSDG